MPFGSHNLHYRIVIVPASRMHRHASWFVDNDDIVIFVYDTDLLCRYGGLVAMEGMRYYIAVFDHCVDRGNLFAIKLHLASLNSLFLHLVLDST